MRLVLCGSGEFTAAMAGVDRGLLDALGRRARVAIVPTAAGREDTPKSWLAMGADHFRALGAEPVPLAVTTRADAEDARLCDALPGVDWIYFSGGDPGYLVETLWDTPFWRAVVECTRRGAILAGSSAGAMMLGSTTLVPLGRGPDGLPTDVTVRPAMGLVPGVIVAPHFDILPGGLRDQWAGVVPADHLLVGIDEDTAAVSWDGRWSVRGRGRVVVFAGAVPSVIVAGSDLDGLLPSPLAYTRQP